MPKKTKKMMSMLLVVTLIAVIAVGGMFAYLISEDSDVNVMTLGNVEIDQTEDFEMGADLYPSTEVKKEVTVKNVGESEAYVRTWFAFEMPKAGLVAPDWADGVNPEGAGTATINGVNYVLYVVDYGKLAKDAEVKSLEKVIMSADATNADMDLLGGTYEVLVYSQAVQTNGFANSTAAYTAAFGNNHPWGDTVELPTAVATAAELETALESGKDVYLTADVTLGGTQIEIPAGKVTLDLNGHDLKGEFADAGHYAMFTIPNGAELTVEGEGEVNATTTAAESNRSLALFLNAGKLTLNGGKYTLQDETEGKSWIIATIVDNRTNSAACEAVLTINGGEYAVEGKAKNLFRNYPQQGGSATIIFNDGVFHDNDDATTTYIWNQEAGTYLGELYFNGGTYESKIVYEDYNGQTDIHIAPGVVINAYSGNN